MTTTQGWYSRELQLIVKRWDRPNCPDARSAWSYRDSLHSILINSIELDDSDTQHGRSQPLPQEPRSRYHDEHSGEEPLRGSAQLKI
jgi:hypothetical protein